MTGVFHFMAISFCWVAIEGKLRGRRSPVNSSSLWPAALLRAGFSCLLVVVAILSASIGGTAAAETAEPRFAVLVFSKTSGFRHDSIPQGIAALEALGAEHRFVVDSTED